MESCVLVVSSKMNVVLGVSRVGLTNLGEKPDEQSELFLWRVKMLNFPDLDVSKLKICFHHQSRTEASFCFLKEI